jgi:hypothetical protein
LRVAVAMAVAIAAGIYMPIGSRLLLLVEAPVVAGVFVLVSVVLGELSRADLARVSRGLGRKPS